MRVSVSLPEARRIALAASGFDHGRTLSGRLDARHVRRVLSRLGLVQLDFVNVLMPAQNLIFWSRLGAYDRSRLHDVLYRRREYTEQWAHEASIVPVEAWPLLAWRRRAHRLHEGSPLRSLRNWRRYLDDVLRRVDECGGLTANDLPAVPGPERRPGDWHRSIPRRALEFHFARGELAIADRLPNFQRVYDLADRLIPAPLRLAEYSREDASRELLRIAARAMGIASLRDLADYYRMSPREAGLRIAELQEEGELTPVAVEGWDEPAYLARGAKSPRRIPGAALLSPFDPVVWYRPRAERLFGFHYRIEIYVPASKRRWGYYVLPFRQDDRLVARVDLKADRAESRLLVRAAYPEASVDTGVCAAALSGELRRLAAWLGLERIDVARRNDLGRALARAVKEERSD